MSRSTNAESGWLVYLLLLWPVGAESSFGFWTKKSWTKCWLCQNHWFWNGSTFCLVAEHLMTNTFSKLTQRPDLSTLKVLCHVKIMQIYQHEIPKRKILEKSCLSLIMQKLVYLNKQKYGVFRLILIIQ